MSHHLSGWNVGLQEQIEQLSSSNPGASFRPARVTVEHRGAYQLITEAGPCTAELTGRLRHQALDKRDLPAVGDWVVLDASDRIDAVLPRKSAFVRKAAGARTEPQVVAANLDVVFIVTSANADFNPRRIERYIAAVAESGATPVLVLNKTDLCDDVEALLGSLGPVGVGLAVARVSALAREGLGELSPFLQPGVTVALVGSSGVGKSTIANWLLDHDALDTGEIREHDARGRHTTTHRELLELPGGGALIDTPGMRELALWSDEADLAGSFADVEALTQACRFLDCQHQGQPGCAIERALAAGELDAARLESYGKLQRELERNTRAARQAQKRLARSRTKAMRERKRHPGGGKPG